MKKKIIVGLVILLCLIAVIGYNYVYQDHREIATERPKVEMNSESISQMFKLNSANDLLNATVSVTGIISEIDENTITLDEKVSCSFAEISSELEIGQAVKIKGRCIGYDDLFEIVKLDQCTILN